MIREPITSLEVKDLVFATYGGELLFSQVNLSIPMNRVVWLRGDSCTGKSVLAKMICALLMPDAGQIIFNNKIASEMTFEEFQPIRCNIGYGFDFGGLINNRDILGNLILVNEYHNFDFGTPDEMVARVNYYLDQFGLTQVSSERPSAIVGGLRKATCVARAFIHEPEMVILDDPTTGLRRETRTRLKKIIKEKMAANELKHVIIASDDSEFMSDLNPVIIEISNQRLHLINEEVAA